MAKDDGRITYESLTKIYREEMGSSTLTVIRKDFYVVAQELLSELTKECNRLTAENPDSTSYEIVAGKRRKIQSHLKTIVEYRMDKIAKLALLGARGSNNIIDDLTAEEKEYYESMIELSKGFLKLSDVKKKEFISQDITEIAAPAPVKDVPAAPVVEKIAVEDVPLSEIPIDDTPEEAVTASVEEAIENIPEDVPPVPEEGPEVDLSDDGTVVVRILEDLEPFSGMDDIVYDLKKEDVVRLPAIFAKALINRGTARVVPTA